MYEVYRWKDVKKFIFTKYNAFLKFYNRKFFIDYDLFYDKVRFGEDVLTHIKSLILSNKIAFLDNDLYICRSNRIGSLMYNAINTRNINPIIIFLYKVYKFLIKMNLYNELKHEYEKFIDNQLQYYLITRNPNNIFKIKFINKIKRLFKKQLDISSILEKYYWWWFFLMVRQDGK